MAQHRQSGEQDILSVTASDARADRGRRHVAVGTQRVTIRRRIHGIEMRLSLAVSAYRGVALCLTPGSGDAWTYEVRLVHRDHDLCVVLDEASTDQDIIADWRLWARVLGLPALVERELGAYEAVSSEIEAGPDTAIPRRKRRLARQSRFLAERDPGDLSRMEVVHSGEDEMIARC